MALTVTTLATDVTAPINNVLMRGLLSAAKRVFPYHNGTMPGELGRQGGSLTVKWRRIENLSAATTALGEVVTAAFGMGRTPAQPTVTDLTTAVAKYGNFMYVSEEVDLININSRTAQLVDNLGENAGHSLNILQRNVYNSETTARFADGVASTSLTVGAIDANDIKYTVNQLNRKSAMKFFPMSTGADIVDSKAVRASYFGIVHPDVEEDIRDITGFIGVEQYGGYTETFVGEFGAVKGVRWAATEVAPVNSGAGVTSVNGMRGPSALTNDVYSSFVYGREAAGAVGLDGPHEDGIYMGGDDIRAIELIQKSTDSGGVSNPFNEVGSIAWKAWWAGKVLNSDWLKKIETLASDLA